MGGYGVTKLRECMIETGGNMDLLLLIAVCAPLLIVVGWVGGHED